MSLMSSTSCTINGARITATGSRTRSINLGENVFKMCLKRGRRQILYMQLNKNKNKKKNYSRKSVILYIWLRSVGTYE